jgi:hypothetical protein
VGAGRRGVSWLPGDGATPAAFPGLPSDRLSSCGRRSRVTVARPRRIRTGFPRDQPVKPGEPSLYAGPVSTVARIVRTPSLFCLATLVITTLGLALDSLSGLGAQTLLGICTWGFLAIAFIHLTPMERAQTSVVVVVATCAEVVGSILWGLYHYRLGNLPLFVPPGHGLVYLTGLRMSQGRVFVRHRRVLVWGAIAGASAWAGLGLVALGRTDAAGAFGVAVLVAFLLRGRAPQVYAGVFVAVAFLEIYGTAIGTWHWAAEVPGLGIPDGNPPSGAASGYVFFDIAALALAPGLLALAARLRGAAAPVAAPDPAVQEAG